MRHVLTVAPVSHAEYGAVQWCPAPFARGTEIRTGVQQHLHQGSAVFSVCSSKRVQRSVSFDVLGFDVNNMARPTLRRGAGRG